MRNNGPVTASPRSSRDVVSAPGSTNLADLLERVLDKGIVIAGDITLFLGGVQLLTLKIRLLIASVDKAQELGINWWQSDPALSSRASARPKELEQERDLLKKRLDRLERLLLPPPQEADQERAAAGQRSTAAPAYVLDRNGKVSAELKQPVQPQEDEGSQVQERAPQPEAAQAEQPAGAGPLLDSALHERIAQAGQRMEQARPEGRQEEEQQQEEEQPQALERASQPEAAQAEQPAGAGPLLGPALPERIAQAMRPVLEGLPQWIAQAWQPGEQARPEDSEGRSNSRRQDVLPRERSM
jgi:Gas vesicle protein